MSGSDTGVNVMTTTTTTNREPFNTINVIQKNTIQQSGQNMRLAFSVDDTAVYKPITPASPSYQPPAVAGVGSGVGGGGGGSQSSGQGLNMNVGSEQMKRKRGRPRKYLPDGGMSLALVPFPSSAAGGNQQSGGGFSSPREASAGGSASPNSMKKSRGRPAGSGRKHQLEALGSAGIGFTPHVITVKTGEDVSSKIMSFSQHGPRAVCILSANGAISNVTLRQPATSGGTVTYEGRFEILSLSGSFLLSENGGQRSRTGGLSVSLSGPDGRVLGGSVAGLLTAATPVQVIVGSFIADDSHGRGGKESKSFRKMEPSVASPKIAPGGMPAGASSPPSRGTISESSGGPGSPINQSTGACNNNIHQQGVATSVPWK